jgi:DNA repair exonuclease SbcCD ATPase subunit
MIKTFFKLSGATLITLLLLTACGGKTDTSALEQTIDSLRQANQQQQNSLQEMTTFVTTMSDGMNAIAQQENMIFNNGGNEGTSLDKEQLKSHLETLANTLTEQRSKIKALSDSLKARGADLSKMQGLIDNLTRQLEEKDTQLQQLRAELEAKDIKIGELSTQVSDLSDNVSTLQEESSQKSQTIESQDKQLHTAWFVFGTKKELKAQHIIEDGKVLQSNFNQDYFTKIDIRVDKEIRLYSRSAKLLTAHPASSYTLTQDANKQYILRITNPQLFWSASKYLVVVVK